MKVIVRFVRQFQLLNLQCCPSIQKHFIFFMYKPSLKRSQLPTQSKEQKNTSSPFKKMAQRVERADNDSMIISSRLLDTPNNRGKDRKAVIAPLFAQSHPYPPSVAAILEENQQSRKSIGCYKEINWISVGNKVEFWITGETTINAPPQEFHGDIACLAVGELKNSSLPLKVRGHYILAVGIKNEVVLYCLQSFTLRLWETGIRYTLAFSWQVQRIQFIDGYKMIIYSTPNHLRIVEFGESNRIIETAVPFYRKYLPTTFSQPQKNVENIIYSRNRIYILFTEVKERFWLVSTVRKLIEQDAYDPYIRTKVIESYGIGDNGIQQLYKFNQQDLRRRIKNYAPGWKSDDIKIQNIFIDRDGKQEQLGIITECGACLTLRDMGQVYFSKDPSFLQNTITFQSAYLLSEASPFTYKPDKDNHSCEVMASLGCSSLTLTNDSLLCVGADRVDGIHSENLVAEMLLRRTTPSQCYLFNTNDWSVFTRHAFYTVRQLPVRHFLIAIIYTSITQLDDYQPLSCQNISYKKMMERVEQALTPQAMLKNLIEIIISGQRYVAVNNIVLELVQRELKGESPQNYRDWGHELKPSLVKKEIQVTTDILSKVWNLVFTLQYKELPVNQAKSKHICDMSVYWLAVHQIYHQLVSPLFKFTTSQFKANRQLIENTFHRLTSLQNFFELKFKHQNLIRQQSISRLSQHSSNSFGEDINKTQSSIDRDAMDISWVEEAACRTISSKIMSENIIQVQERLKKAVTLTLNLMTVYFGLATNQVKLPSFGEILRNRADQQLLAKVIIAHSDFATLVDIDSKIPQLDLKKDINFRRWANRMEMEHQLDSNVDLEELAGVINSNYFEESQRLIGNRYDLQIKMLEIYQQLILAKRDALIQTNTLKQRNFLSRTLFPEDEEASLTSQREYLSTELEQIIQEEKKCLHEAVVVLGQQKQSGKWGKIMDELIMIASNKPSLYDHLENELKNSGNLEKFSKLQKHKYKEYHKYAYNKKISLRRKLVERELFPHP